MTWLFREQAIILSSSCSGETLQGEGNLSLTVVRFGSRLVDTFAMGSAPGVVTTRVRLMGDLCYCSHAVVLRCTALGCGPAGPAGGGHGQRETCVRGGPLPPSCVVVAFRRRRTHHDYADYLGEITGRQLAGI
jgi:hypothetical protein